MNFCDKFKQHFVKVDSKIYEVYFFKKSEIPIDSDSGISFTSFTAGSLYNVMQPTDCSVSFFLVPDSCEETVTASATLYLLQILGYSSFGQDNCTAEVTQTHWLYSPD